MTTESPFFTQVKPIFVLIFLYACYVLTAKNLVPTFSTTRKSEFLFCKTLNFRFRTTVMSYRTPSTASSVGLVSTKSRILQAKLYDHLVAVGYRDTILLNEAVPLLITIHSGTTWKGYMLTEFFPSNSGYLTSGDIRGFEQTIFYCLPIFFPDCMIIIIVTD